MKKALVKLLQRLFANLQECSVAELLGMLPGMTYTLLLKSGCCAKSFEFQPRLEWECGFGTQPGLVTSDQNKHFFPHPKTISARSLYFSKYLEGIEFLPTNFGISQVSRNMKVEGEFCLTSITSDVCHPSPERSFLFLIGGYSFYDVLLNMAPSIVCCDKDFTFYVDAMAILSSDHKKQCLKNSASKHPLT